MISRDDHDFAESGTLPWDLDSYGRLHAAAVRAGVRIGGPGELALCRKMFPSLSEREALAHVRRHWHIEFALQHFEPFLVDYGLMKPSAGVGEMIWTSQSMMEVLMRSPLNGRTRDRFGTDMPTFNLPQVVTDSYLWDMGWRGGPSQVQASAGDSRLEDVAMVSATTWYWALGRDGVPHKLSARLAEQAVSPMVVCDGPGPGIRPIATEWAGPFPARIADDHGRIRVVAVVVLRVDGKSRFIERTRVCTRRITSVRDALDDMLHDGPSPFDPIQPVEVNSEEWERVAEAVVRRARIAPVNIGHLAFRLSKAVGGRIPVEVAHAMGDSRADEHYRINVDGALYDSEHGPIWDLRWGTLVPPHVPLMRSQPITPPSRSQGRGQGQDPRSKFV